MLLLVLLTNVRAQRPPSRAGARPTVPVAGGLSRLAGRPAPQDYYSCYYIIVIIVIIVIVMVVNIIIIIIVIIIVIVIIIIIISSIIVIVVIINNICIIIIIIIIIVVVISNKAAMLYSPAPAMPLAFSPRAVVSSYCVYQKTRNM